MSVVLISDTSVYVNSLGSFLYYSTTIGIVEEYRHVFKIIEYPFDQKFDYYNASMEALNENIGNSMGWIKRMED